jgi:hypothetical protein
MNQEKPSIEQKWHEMSEATRRKARQLETASQMNQWLSSSELMQ